MDGPSIPTATILALAIAACSDKVAEKTYEASATDESNGELIARDPDTEEVQVELPETTMTPTAEGTDGRD